MAVRLQLWPTGALFCWSHLLHSVVSTRIFNIPHIYLDCRSWTFLFYFLVNLYPSHVYQKINTEHCCCGAAEGGKEQKVHANVTCSRALLIPPVGNIILRSSHCLQKQERFYFVSFCLRFTTPVLSMYVLNSMTFRLDEADRFVFSIIF